MSKKLISILVVAAALVAVGAYIFIREPEQPTKIKPTGWFKTGQDADMLLYAFGLEESGGPSVLNHPSKVATDGTHLIVSDTRNNRVLIWNSIPTQNGRPADIVLGQPDMNSNAPKLGADGLNFPVGVATDGNRLLVADAFNHRVLIWSEFPTRNGQPADLVLGVPDFENWPGDWEVWELWRRDPKTWIYWPWDVFTDGTKVFVTSTTDGSVLVWNSFPTENNQPADMILGRSNFSQRFQTPLEGYDPLATMMTPRSIAFDGQRLVVGDYNAHVTFVWSEAPTENGEAADFFLNLKRTETDPVVGHAMGLALKDNKLFATAFHGVYIWNSFPTNAGQGPDVVLGKADPGLGDNLLNSPYGVATDGTRLFVADTNNNRVLIYNQIPMSPGVKADVVLGAPDFTTDVFVSSKSVNNPAPFTDGNRLFVVSDHGRIHIYNKLPDENSAPADVVIDAKNLGWGAMNQATSDGTRLIIAAEGSSKVLIWDSIPTRGDQAPDVVLGVNTILQQWETGTGRTGFNQPRGIATDGKSLFVSDSRNNRILVWNQIPTENQTPADFVLGQDDFETTTSGGELNKLNYPAQLSADENHLVAADLYGGRILVWNLPITGNGQPADFEVKSWVLDNYQDPLSIPKLYRLDMPQGVFSDGEHLFVADTGNNRVLVWSQFPTTGKEKPGIVLGQENLEGYYPSNAKDKLFMPSFLSFDGSYLWVGEFKWSDRLVRFSVQP